jgi:hypothetical protein
MSSALQFGQDGSLHLNGQATTQNGTGQDNSTVALIESLVFAESKSVRTSTVILAAFNILAALTTAFSILYDCYWASKMCSPGSKAG